MTPRTRTQSALVFGAASPDQAFLVIRIAGDERIVPLIEAREVTVGRSRASTIFVDDEHVSRHHARIIKRGEDVIVIDLGSRNGTYVRGERVEGECRASGGDQVTIGPLIAIVAHSRTSTSSASSLAPVDHVVADPAMARVFELCRRVAATPLSVLISGETGVGKESVAEAIHRFGPRSGGPFVRLHMSALPEALLESELFGHEKGAFTGASKRRVGYFESAAGGTLFLDEIGELPLGTQAKLLRALENHKIVRLGSSDEVPVDVRIVAATNRDLAEEVRTGRFRQDLYFRLSAFRIDVPALRERQSEIPVLALLFAREIAQRLGSPPPVLLPETLSALTAHPWPGNVRELKHAMEAALVLAAPGDIRAHHLALALGSTSAQTHLRTSGTPTPVPAVPLEGAHDPARDLPSAVELVEREAILAALAGCSGNQTKAAAQLRISRRALIYKMRKHGIPGPRAA